MGVSELRCQGLDPIAKNSVQVRAFISTVMNIWSR
jgi:hypothetical protein